MNQAKRPQFLQNALRAAVRCTLGPNEDREPALEAIDALPVEAPSVLRTVYATLAGCTIVPEDGVATDVFDVDELASANARSQALPGAVMFASDGGSGWYFLDAAGAIGGTPGAVMWADRSAMQRGYTRRIARDLAQFLHAAARGELAPSRRPTVDDTDAAELGAVLEARRDRWSGKPPRDVVELFEAGVRVGCSIDGDVAVLLEISDGMDLPYAHVTLWELARIERAGEADGLPEQRYEQVRLPTGLWIGTRGTRRLLCCTGITGWRGLVANTVVAVALGEPIDEAPVLGRLGTLVRTWVG